MLVIEQQLRRALPQHVLGNDVVGLGNLPTGEIDEGRR